ncbi:Acyl-protein thioesterase 2 [Glycine soja]
MSTEVKSEVTKQKELRESRGNEEANKDRPGRKGKSPYAFLGLFLTSLSCLENMSYSGSSMSSGSGSSRRTFEFGRTHVVRPKGKHQATIVWLHGLGDNGSSWSQLLETLPLPNIKWICPTAPTRPVALFGGFPCTACKIQCLKFYIVHLKTPLFFYHFLFYYKICFYTAVIYSNLIEASLPGFDAGEISEDAPIDLEGLDASAAHVANLLSTEPPNIKLGIGGFSMGAATALYSATCHILGHYGNGNIYPINLSAIVSLSGWLPCSRTLKNQIEQSRDGIRRAALLPLFLCHGRGDDVVAYEHGERSAVTLSSSGFQNLIFRSYNGLGHYTVPEETDEVCRWLTANLGLEGFRLN